MWRHGVPVAAIVCLVGMGFSARTRTAPVQPAGTKGASAATFVGADACASCHAETHAAWKSGRHSKMLQPATAASVKGDFAQRTVALNGRRYELRAANGEYSITESFLTGKPTAHRIDYTLGSRRIQHYLTTLDNGWIVVLPPSWDVQRQRWFDNVEIIRPDEDSKKIVQQWNRNCVGCHVSQQDNRYSPRTRTYATTWTDFGTSCERCHGPGSAHVQRYRDGGTDPTRGDRAIVRPTRLEPATSTMVCAQCHSLRDVIAPGFSAGANYYDHFQPLLEYRAQKPSDPSYWADGRPRRFSNDAIGLWQSECFLRGGVTCASCHDPHAPDVDRHAELAPANNALCTRCHQQIGAALSAHTRHAATGAGSSCVECHMPKTVVSIKATMRDHTIGIPAPENTVAFGIPNACSECHSDKPATWAAAAVERWWPEGRRTKWLDRARTFTAARAVRPEALERLIAIAGDGRQGPIVQANAVGYLGSYRDPRAVAALLAAAGDKHPVIRSIAMVSLGMAGGGEAPQAAILAGLDDPQRAVRIAALMSVINRGIRPLPAPDLPRFRRVSAEFAARAGPYEDDARIQRDLGLVQLLAGEVDRGADALEISVDLEPDRPSTKFLLAMARIGQQRVDEARALLKQVPRSDPYYDAAQQSLQQLAGPK